MSDLTGTPSDDVPEVLGIGRCVVNHIFVSMSARHPEGRDADYLRWHSYDHRPEQYRLDSVRASIRLVSTPECRAARAANDVQYGAVDHVMTYFFASLDGFKGFSDLAVALGGAGRIPYLLPLVERGVYRLDGMVASARIKVGADVLPWWPIRGVYILVERGQATSSEIVDVPGVAGVWWGESTRVDDFPTADGSPMSSLEGLQLTYCFLDDDPVATAQRLHWALEKRWLANAVEPLLAAPFFTVPVYDFFAHTP